MARRATPVTKGRSAPKKTAASATQAREASTPTRRAAKAKPQDESPIELPVVMPGEMPAPDAAAADAPMNDAEPAAKGRRGRKTKPEVTAAEPEIAAAPETPEVQADAPKAPSSPRKTRRNREPEASAPPPLETADEPSSEPQASAVEWNSGSDTVTFDWPAIEQVAAVEGENQPMAKLLLAARAEGARSRWPF